VTLAEALAARAEALCAIPSPIGHEQAICDEVERWARPLFAEVRRVRNSLVVGVDAPLAAAGARAAPPASGRPTLALCGHLDTVPIHAADEGRFPRREEGRLVAPGASDMKSGVAVGMELAARVPARERFCDLVLVLYSREEGPYAENELGDVLREVPELSRAALAICLEPTDCLLQLGCVGSIHGTATFLGRSAHSARPWQGENAIHKAGALLLHLAERQPRDATSGGLPFREVISATRIEGGRARNVIPDRCSVNLNFRFAPDRSLERARHELEALVGQFGGELEIVDLSPACPAYAEHPLVERLVARTGARTEPKQAWTDVARLSAAGVPAVNFGPGTTSQSHQVGEWVDLSSLERSYRMLEAFLRA
jgi:succinyl-diaminopimelate desuccinylase